MPHKQEVSDKIRTALKSIVDHFDQEDRAVRDRQIRLWRRMKLYWDGFQKVWYSEVAHDWRIYDDQNTDNDSDNSYYDKPVNVFRAYLESIIAALSVSIPPIRCSPDDATNPLDLATAKAGNIISELVYKHNDVTLLWLHSLYIFVTEGLVACHNYTDTDKKYGTYTTNDTEDVDVTGRFCPECDGDVSEYLTTLTSSLSEGGAPFSPVSCPECDTTIDIPEETTKTVIRIVGTTDHPKSRQKLDCYGGLYVKIPNYAMDQSQCPYLTFSEEIHFANAIEKYPDLDTLDNDWQSKVGYDSGGVYDPYERWGRLNPQYNGEYPINTVTIRKSWLRPCSYNVLDSEDEKLVRDKFPDGCCVVLANEEIAEDPIPELLDDHWTLTCNPLSDYLHHDPLGLLLTSIQDITNELVSLTLQTIEHGIPQTFADPAVLNFNAYSQTEVSPGTIYPAKPKAGKSIGDAFYEIRTATLSAEVLPFGQQIQNYGQLVSGATPAIFGGEQKGAGGDTAAGYSMSRAQALQRLQIPWKMLSIWWKTIFSKVIPSYIDSVKEDERHVIKDPNAPGNFINIFINKADIQGKIGDIECDTADQLPTTWSTMKDTIMRLMELPHPAILSALSSPENLPFIAEAIGLNKFIIPGEADRTKQYEEITLLVNSAPIPREIPAGPPDPVTGQPTMIEEEGPSVPIDIEVDNHAIQAFIVRTWAVSEAGILAKTENPEGYKNTILHLKMHLMAEQMQQQAQAPQQASEEASTEEGVPVQ